MLSGANPTPVISTVKKKEKRKKRKERRGKEEKTRFERRR
jgi:hypothetical protein